MRAGYRPSIPTRRDLLVRAAVLAGALMLSVCLGSAASTTAPTSASASDDASMALSAGGLMDVETAN